MTPNDQQVVVGVFEDQAMAERAVDALENAGFNSDQIGFVRRDRTVGTDGQSATAAEGANDTAGGAMTGAVSGGILGGILGAAAALLIPGIGPVVAGGILATTLAGAAVGAAAGGLLGALTKMGVPEEEARYYQGEFEQGRTIVTVRANGRQQEAIQILRRHGAYDATTRSMGTAGAGTGYGVSQGNMEMQSQQPYDSEGGQRVQIREEQLQAQKQPVQTGEVQIGKQVTEREQTLNVPVTREEVFIERRDFAPQPTDQPITEGDDQTIRVPVVEEQVRVTKQPVVTGEVVVGKRQVEENQQVSDTVRREEPRIERQGDINVQGSGADQFGTDQPENRP